MEEGQRRQNIFSHPRVLAGSLTISIVGGMFLFLHISFPQNTHKQILAASTYISQKPRPTAIPTPTATPTLTPTPTAIPTPTPTPRPTADPTNDTVWDQLAQCESNDNWADNTGNGYFGGLQFSQGAWESVGGSGNPATASRTEQIARGKMLQAQRGWSPWSECSKKLGLY